ncbi:MAG TPA: type II toxin-antitoxin system VapC family toxin [Vicinamibacterales bacterium]|nr:type II toxin-antitoxin system VapC family toxin [Vicinamibacterales bacterium]
MRAADTNVLVRLLTRDDPQQTAAAERWIGGGAWVPILALAETTWVLDAVYERTREQIASAISMLLDHTELTLQDPDVVAAALEQFTRRSSPGFTDCLLLEIARKAGHLPLGTFERQLGRLDGAERLR